MDDQLRKYWAWQNAGPTVFSQDIRKTRDGWLIKLDEHGQRTLYGWHSDHIIPLSAGGPDIPSNVCARYWRDNVKAGAAIAAVQSGMTDAEKRSPAAALAATIANQPTNPPPYVGMLTRALAAAQSPDRIQHGLLFGMRPTKIGYGLLSDMLDRG